MQTVEEYTYSGPGYNPFLIRSGWQVAQLNYAPELSPAAIDRLERHKATDEVFILFCGKSVLITGVESENGFQIESLPMRPAVAYNIPAGVWHAIALQPKDVVFIVENSNTHLCDVEYRDLRPTESGKLTGAPGA